jgi:hypothetical protein
LIISVGTLIIAVGFFGFVSSKSASEVRDNYNLIGVGITTISLGAFCVAIDKFMGNP